LGFLTRHWRANRVPQGGSETWHPALPRSSSAIIALTAIIYIDLVGLGEQDAEHALLDGLKPSGKPAQLSPFPGKRAEPSISTAPFPPNIARLHGVPELPPHYLPRPDDFAGLRQKLLTELVVF
jgi:hypothetical protein